jgi:hypothetical protein
LFYTEEIEVVSVELLSNDPVVETVDGNFKPASLFSSFFLLFSFDILFFCFRLHNILLLDEQRLTTRFDFLKRLNKLTQLSGLIIEVLNCIGSCKRFFY